MAPSRPGPGRGECASGPQRPRFGGPEPGPGRVSGRRTGSRVLTRGYLAQPRLRGAGVLRPGPAAGARRDRGRRDRRRCSGGRPPGPPDHRRRHRPRWPGVHPPRRPPAPVPEPFAAMLTELAANHANMNMAANPARLWLLPGGCAGQPVAPGALVQQFRVPGAAATQTRTRRSASSSGSPPRRSSRVPSATAPEPPPATSSPPAEPGTATRPPAPGAQRRPGGTLVPIPYQANLERQTARTLRTRQLT